VKDKNNKMDIEINGRIETKVNSQNTKPNNIERTKSGGNNPSDLGAIKKPQNSNDVKPLNNQIKNTPSSSNNIGANNVNRNNISGKNGKLGKSKLPKNKMPINKNPILNQNRMKGFGRDKKNTEPKLNPSAPFFNGSKGLFNGKGLINKSHPNVLDSLSSSISKTSKDKIGTVNKALKKQGNVNLFAFFGSLPLHVKVAIIGGGLVIILVLIVILIIIASKISAASGNRDMKTEYLQGNYTDAELCEYLEQNDYIDLEDNKIKCEDTKAYKFFVNFKELKDEYEKKYERYRFQVNVELIYETLSYYSSDEEMYNSVTKDEIRKLIDASLEEIEETCVVKTYDKKKDICTQKKYVYSLYEFSLDKYISYLKYGETSNHPNYGNDKENKSSNGKAVERKCGEGKNVDYVFGFGLVNTSSSPLSEGSNCPDPNHKVTEEDYKNLPKEITTLEELNAWGGVPKFSHIYDNSN